MSETKEKLIALRMTPDELAQIDAATRRFAGGLLEPSRSQMIRLLLRLGLSRIESATAEELARLVVGGSEPSKPSSEEQLRAEVALKRKVEADLDAAERQAQIEKRQREAARVKEAEEIARKERLNRPTPPVHRIGSGPPIWTPPTPRPNPPGAPK